jgi:putative membrane protein (TIGR04086 family)
MRVLQWKAIIYGVSAFIAAWILIWVLYSSFIASADGRFKSELHFQIYGAITFVLSGYISARSVQNNFILHGAATGMVVSLIIIVFWLLVDSFNQNTLYSFIVTPIYIIVMSSLGGIITKWQRNT